MKILIALLLLAGGPTFAAQVYSPEVNPDTGRPALSLRFNNANGTVDVHSGGRWIRARHFDQSSMHVNKVEVPDASPDSSWFLNFWYGDYYDYGYTYPNNYYYYTPNYSVWYGGYSYYPYNSYNRDYYTYYTYYW